MVLRAPSGMKSALGENPKRVYGERKQMPSTRLGTAAVIRDAFVKAGNYLAKRDREGDEPVERDLRWEALGLVLEREIPWRQHCHRADDIATALRLADEFGYRLVIDHGTEAVPARRPAGRARRARPDRPAADLPLQGRAAQPLPGQPGPPGRRRGRARHHHRPPGRPRPLPARPGRPGRPRGPRPRRPPCAPSPSTRPGSSASTTASAPWSPGKHATLCIWSGDPLDARSRVETAWIEGRQVFGADPDNSPF